jgi:hypothetical protein
MANGVSSRESHAEHGALQSAEPKRLILCLDGTWNQADAKTVTNIVRIRDLIRPRLDGPGYQRVYYHTGVGTGLNWGTNVLDGATGRGLGANVRSIYKFLSQNYTNGLEIYVFGFSRGAFTARSVVAYIAASGLLKPEHCSPENETQAWAYYRCSPDRRYPNEYEALRKLSFDPDQVRVRVLGVFDTVGALGVPVELFRSWNRERFRFHDVTLGTNVDYAFHALAIDEKRGPFQASLWQYPNHHNYKRVEQVWFPGAHANVGGGYEHEGLSRRALYWMMSRIERNQIGLKFIDGWQNRVESLLDIMDTLDDSRDLLYSWSKIRPMVRVINQRRLNLGRLPRLSALPPHAIPLGEMLWIAGPTRRTTVPRTSAPHSKIPLRTRAPNRFRSSGTMASRSIGYEMRTIAGKSRASFRANSKRLSRRTNGGRRWSVANGVTP